MALPNGSDDCIVAKPEDAFQTSWDFTVPVLMPPLLSWDPSLSPVLLQPFWCDTFTQGSHSNWPLNAAHPQNLSLCSFKPGSESKNTVCTISVLPGWHFIGIWWFFFLSLNWILFFEHPNHPLEKHSRCMKYHLFMLLRISKILSMKCSAILTF